VRGWYPDPDGTPGRLRFWDGTAWTTQTSPAAPPPDQSPTSSVPGEGTASERKERVSRRGRSLTIAILAVLLLFTLIGTVAVVRSRADRDLADPAPTGPSRSSYDDSSPLPSPTPSTPSPPRSTPRPTPSTPERRSADCDKTTADQLPRPATDGRVHGGPLSFAAMAPPWSPATSTGRFPFSRDSYVQTLRLPEVLPWQASAQVGVASFASYPGRHVAAEAMLNCLLTSDFYTSVHVTVTRSKGSDLKVSGIPASRLDAVLTFSQPDLTTRGSQVRIIVVDTSPVTYYFHAVPMERTDLIRVLDRATDSLTAG
jgi:hypothetical protein